MRVCFLLFMSLFSFPAQAQEINNLLSFRQPQDAAAYFRLCYENDYFSASDRYYTQGIQVELVSPSLRMLPFHYLFPKLKNSTLRHGLAIESNAYTPGSIQSDDILYGDRPFSATLMLRSFSISSAGRSRLSSALSMGIIGPGAGGYEMQYGIHSRTGNILPKGWQHQIANDLLLNYEVNYERSLLPENKIFAMSAILQGKLGTVSTKAGLGAGLMLGFMPRAGGQRKWNLYAYGHPQVQLVGYDATLQGGIFNRSSDYTLRNSQLNRLVARYQYGFVFSWKKVYLEYFQKYVSKEFAEAKDHRTGGIQAAILF